MTPNPRNLCPPHALGACHGHKPRFFALNPGDCDHA
jgi:hypothetical protein